MRDQSDGRSRSPRHRLDDQLFFFDPRQLFHDQIFILSRRRDHDISFRDDFRSAIVCFLDHRFGGSQFLELLGHIAPAQGPQARACPAGHDDRVPIFPYLILATFRHKMAFTFIVMLYIIKTHGSEK
jgi:hypothetical protein